MILRTLILLSLFAAALPNQVSASSLDENKQLVQAFVDANNAREFDRIGEFVAENFVRHCQSTPGLVVENREQFRAFIEGDLEVCPDSVVEIHQMVAEGDRVAIWATYTGTQEGAMGRFPPSGKQMSLEFAAIWRVEDDKLAELWVIWDNLAGLAQLGHFPPPADG